jgi:hypothetical protein
MRVGYLNRIKLLKEEQRILESKGKNKRPTALVEDHTASSLMLNIKVLHLHYKENDYLVKESLKELLFDEEKFSQMIKKNQLINFKQIITYE